MQPHGLYSRHGSPSTSHSCSVTFIGLRVPQRIEFKLAVLAFRCLLGMAPILRGMARELRRVADIDSRRRLRSASTSALEVPSTRHVTIGDRAFGVAAARVWNTLSADVTSSSSLPVFKRHLKTFLYTNFHAWNCHYLLYLL